MIKKAIFLLFCFASGLVALAQSWHQDILGADFEMRYVNQGYDNYTQGERCTLVRLLSPHGKGRAVVYIHGFNDYFFQAEMARQFANHGYNFYAVDLRKYGRSIMPGQRKFDMRSMNEYFPDVDSALTAARRDGNYELVLMGHSTGGLLASYYLARNPAAPVDALILNSPFLDWNLGWKEHLVPLVSAIGWLFPNLPIPQGDSDVYSQSLLKTKHGQWTYNTDWKIPVSPDVTAGWVRGISMAQDYLHSHKYSIHIPILLMYSAASSTPTHWTPQASTSDVVLDVRDIRHYGLLLSTSVTPVVVKGGVHDLMLSSPALRSGIYRYIFSWLNHVK